MICELLIGKDLEGRSLGLIEAFFDNFLYQLREIIKNLNHGGLCPG
jgi:hypothetical protein